MTTERNQTLILHSASHSQLDIKALSKSGDGYTFLTHEKSIEKEHSFKAEFSLVLADLAGADLDQQKAILNILDQVYFHNATLAILVEARKLNDVMPALIEKSSILQYHPIDTEKVEKLIDDCWHTYHQKRAISKDLQSIMKAFKTMDKGSFPFKSLSEAKSLSLLLSIMCPNSNDAAVGLLELMVNGIEHGNLEISFDEKGALLKDGTWQSEIENRLNTPKYAERIANIVFEKTDNQIEFLISDEGPGFSPSEYLSEKPKDPQQNSIPDFSVFHGRGIKIAKQICFDELEYQGRGNQVKATIRL